LGTFSYCSKKIIQEQLRLSSFREDEEEEEEDMRRVAACDSGYITETSDPED
jgi:hypothetical protein